MRKDLTDYVREKDESEGPPMKPVTDAEAEELRDEYAKLFERFDSTFQADLRMTGPVMRLLRDREVAMEVIDELKNCLLELHPMRPDEECHIYQAYKEARALIAAVRREEE